MNLFGLIELIQRRSQKENLMNRNKAIKMFEEAELYCEKNHPDELIWAKGIGPETFNKLTSKQFLDEYCWVVYVSGFKVSTIKSIFPIVESQINLTSNF
jgi:hypothetical protein